MKGFVEVTGVATDGLSSENFPPLGRDPPSWKSDASKPGSSTPQPKTGVSSGEQHEACSDPSPYFANWRNFFQNDSVNQLKICPPKVKNRKKSVFISKSIHKQGIQIWDDNLICLFYGSPPPLF